MLELKRTMARIRRLVLPADPPRWTPVENAVDEAATPVYHQPRRSPRHELEMTLTATTRDGKVYRGFTRDMSSEGTAALIWGELNIGQEVSLLYELPGGSELIEISSTVRHRTGFRYGFEFCLQDRLEKECEVHKLFTWAPAHQTVH